MSNLASLTAQRDGLLKKIREIEAVCEKNGAERILEACSDPQKLDFYYAAEFRICCVFFMQQN